MTNGSTIIVVEAIASGSAALVVVGTTNNVDIAASGIAGFRGAVEGIGGAAIRVAACLGAISVAEFVGFNNAIAAADTAVIVVIIVAPSRATPVAV